MCPEMVAGAAKCPVKEEKKLEGDGTKAKEEAPAEAAAVQVKKNWWNFIQISSYI